MPTDTERLDERPRRNRESEYDECPQCQQRKQRAASLCRVCSDARRVRPLTERFWEKVNKNGPVHPKLGTPCWLWTATLNNEGYGTFGVGGKAGSMQLAHRVSWGLHHTQPSRKICVLHSCDNPPCVNPDHLFLGTKLDNARDMVAKGRHWVARKTRCVNGHDLQGHNLIERVTPKGVRRWCRICLDAARLRYEQKQ